MVEFVMEPWLWPRFQSRALDPPVTILHSWNTSSEKRQIRLSCWTQMWCAASCHGWRIGEFSSFGSSGSSSVSLQHLYFKRVNSFSLFRDVLDFWFILVGCCCFASRLTFLSCYSQLNFFIGDQQESRRSYDLKVKSLNRIVHKLIWPPTCSDSVCDHCFIFHFFWGGFIM